MTPSEEKNDLTVHPPKDIRSRGLGWNGKPFESVDSGTVVIEAGRKEIVQ